MRHLTLTSAQLSRLTKDERPQIRCAASCDAVRGSSQAKGCVSKMIDRWRGLWVTDRKEREDAARIYPTTKEQR